MYAYALASAALGLPHTRADRLMSTCMTSSDPRASPFTNTTFIHYCRDYYVPETRPWPAYRVNAAAEITRSFTRTGKDSRHVEWYYVFNKHWLKARGHDRWAFECGAAELLAPPPFSAQALEPGLQKHLAVLDELVPAVKRGMAGYRAKYCSKEGGGRDSAAAGSGRRLVLHEAHRATKNKLNHEVDVMPA